jgi:hypothetical protein
MPRCERRKRSAPEGGGAAAWSVAFVNRQLSACPSLEAAFVWRRTGEERGGKRQSKAMPAADKGGFLLHPAPVNIQLFRPAFCTI